VTTGSTAHDRLDDEGATFASVVRPLIDNGILEALPERDDDAQRWMDCDLCSYVENRFHHQLEPEALAEDQRAAWSRRALASDERLWDPRRSEFDAAFWILDRGVRVGTLALSKVTHAYLFMPVSSLYVFPARRSDGHAYRTLRAVYAAAVAAGFAGIRVSTFWTWQAAVRRYLLRYGMWARSFKRSLDFVWASDLPSYTISVDDHTARFAIDHDARTLELLTASREGHLLVWHELPAMSSDSHSRFLARSTFAVALAVHGWPLLRADDDLDAVAGYDIGGPDVLARKIAIFEHIDHQRGFDVRTPRIPGLPYQAITRKLTKE
jgi:GNAT superfamily N-acetyltransferase